MSFIIAFLLIFISFAVFFEGLKLMRYSSNAGKYIPWVIIPILVIILSILYLLFSETVIRVFHEIYEGGT